MSIRSPRPGNAVVWLVLCLGLIVAIVALGTDGGRMMQERRSVQAAADAAALAAAADLYEKWVPNNGADSGGTAKAAALASAAANQYSNDGVTSVVTVNIPPQSGDYSGQAGYVEVVIVSNLPASFSQGIAGSQLPVQARAIARGQPKNIGIVLLSVSASGALTASDSGSVTIAGGSLQVNSTDPAAVTISDSAVVTADTINITGGYSAPGNASLNANVYTGAAPVADPLQTFPVPNPLTHIVQSVSQLNIVGGALTTLHPGVFQGGLSLSGGASVKLSPGVYIMDGGGLQVSDTSSLSGSGVMIYSTTSGSIQISGTGSIDLTAATSGVYRGIALFQDPSLTTGLQITNTANVRIDGLIYAPTANITVTGQVLVGGPLGAVLLGTGYICDTLTVNGTVGFQLKAGLNPPKVPDVRLVQ